MALVATASLLLSALLYALSRDRSGRLIAARAAAGLAAALLTAVLVVRSVLIGFPALTGTYEGLLFTVLVLAAVVALGERVVFAGNATLLAASAFTAFLVMAVLSSPVISADLHPPVPILRSGWLLVHVAFAFVGLALFTVGSIAAAAGMLSARSSRARRSASGAADRVRDTSIALGFVFYATGGLVFGAIWAEAAWGRFWGWDPKETWALVTTIVYAVYLHLRYMRDVSPTTHRVLAILAWLLAIFTFFGVNYLMSGLHSYA